MPSYTAPTKDMQFVLHDLLDISAQDVPGYDDLDRDFTGAILDAAGQLATEVLHPLNEVGDREGCTLENGVVRTPKGFKEAFDQYREGGWTALDADPDYGGQGLPYVMNTAVGEIMSSANMALNMYPGLTHGAYSAIHAHGTDEQKAKWLPKMVSCEWTGTMNLTEPHAGTDLGMMRTKADPQPDGSYKITGQKIFISAGDHDMSDNVVHLVLAKIKDAPEGIKGVSLFIVPKFLVDEDGTVGARNGVSVGKIEEKMGIHGNSTCVMNYDEAEGYLLGTEHKGMRAMFTMMNEARLGVGVQGLAQSEVAYQNAADWARERVQGRSISGTKFPDQKADPIIVHPDVRRMLMEVRAFNEAARALVYWTALQGDIHRRGDDEAAREAADDMMGLLTPVVKAFITDKGFENTVVAQQVFGGSGYTKDQGVEQFVRDARIAMVYEGANGIQALDLVGRKLPRKQGRAVQAYFKEVGAFCSENKENQDLAPFVKPLSKALSDLQASTMWLMQNAMSNPDEAGGASNDYLHLFGYVCFAHMWALMAKAAQDKLAEGANGNASFYENKLATGRFFVERMLPEAAACRARLEAGCESMMALEAEAF